MFAPDLQVREANKSQALTIYKSKRLIVAAVSTKANIVVVVVSCVFSIPTFL